MAKAEIKLNTEMTPDDIRRLRAVSKILARGAIRVAAQMGANGKHKVISEPTSDISQPHDTHPEKCELQTCSLKAQLTQQSEIN